MSEKKTNIKKSYKFLDKKKDKQEFKITKTYHPKKGLIKVKIPARKEE